MAAKKENEKVTIMLQKDSSNYSRPLTVIINGKKTVVERGKPVEVDPDVAEVIKQSMEQDGMTAAFIDRQEKAFAKSIDSGAI